MSYDSIEEVAFAVTSASPLSLKVIGNEAYCLVGNKLEIVDISNPTFPSVRSTSGAADVQVLDLGNTLDVIGGYAYVGASGRHGTIASVSIFNVSDPDNAQFVKTWEITGLSTGYICTDLFIRNTAIFVALRHEAGSDDHVKILDINDPVNPKVISQIDTQLNPLAVKTYGSYAYTLDCTFFGGSNISALQITNISSLDDTQLASRFLMGSVPTISAPYLSDLQIVYPFVYVTISSDSNAFNDTYLRVIDVSNAFAPKFITDIPTGFNQFTGLDNTDSTELYVGKTTSLELFSLENPSYPTKIAQWGGASSIVGADIFGDLDYLYSVTTDLNRLLVLETVERSSSSESEEVESSSSESQEPITGVDFGVVYYNDFVDYTSIPNPVINKDTHMQFKGFLQMDWKKEDLDFDKFGYGLQKTRHNMGRIFAEDASKLIDMQEGCVEILLSVPYPIENGVHRLLKNDTADVNEFIIWGMNMGKYEYALPSLYAAFTPRGIEFTVATSEAIFTIRDTTTNAEVNEEMSYLFFWRQDPSITTGIVVNEEITARGNPLIALDDVSGLNLCVLDTPFTYSNMECTIKRLVVRKTICSEIPESSSSSSLSSTSSFSTLSSDSSSSSSSSSVDSSSSDSSLITSSSSSESSLVTSSSSSVGPCDVVNVSKFEPHPIIFVWVNGTYIWDGTYMNGCKVYKHESKNLWLFSQGIPTPYWRIGPTRGGTDAYFWNNSRVAVDTDPDGLVSRGDRPWLLPGWKVGSLQVSGSTMCK